MARILIASILILGGSGCTVLRTEIEVSHKVKANVPEDAATLRVVLERTRRPGLDSEAGK